jgi:luciferase family oxidoreductase group 1
MTTRQLQLSVLDQSPISQGSTGADALHHSLDLARRADALGYTRYWVAEHHGTPMLACASPEVLIGPIALATERIRVGSGGIMLPHYSPFKVAENFSMLSALAPGRIDLAVGRAAGTDPTTTFALQRDRRQASPDDFPHQLTELLAYLDGTLPAEHPFARLIALPGGPPRPEPWLLGSSPQSAIWAAQLGMPYAFADFINPDGASIMRTYYDRFTPSASHPTPKSLVAVWALAAETEDEARRLGSSARMAFTLFQRGELIPVPPIETAQAFLAAQGPLAAELVRRRRSIVGTADAVRAGIEAVAREYGVDEVMVVTITYEHETRARSYELLARAFGLASTDTPEFAAPAR